MPGSILPGSIRAVAGGEYGRASPPWVLARSPSQAAISLSRRFEPVDPVDPHGRLPGCSWDQTL